jgi:hypothetical protein
MQLKTCHVTYLHLCILSPQQKSSQQRELARDLQQYLVDPSDFYGLLMQQLHSLMRAEQNNMRLMGNMDDQIAVACRWG